MTDLYIDIEAFGQLTNTLEAAAEDMIAATRQLSGAAVEGLGVRALDHAAASFGREWGYGIEQIARATEGIVEAMRTTEALYVMQDDATAQVLGNTGGLLAEAGVLPGDAVARNGSGAAPAPPVSPSSLNLEGW